MFLCPKRMGSPEEMADATLFLSSPLSSYMTVSKYKQPISFLANATVGVFPIQ